MGNMIEINCYEDPNEIYDEPTHDDYYEEESKMTHNIKIKKTFVEPILKGEKTFEIRKNDRGYQKGDRIRFTVVDASLFESRKEQAYRQAIEQRVYEITYVLNGWGLEPDFVAFGIREVGY